MKRAPAQLYLARHEALRTLIREAGLDAMVVTSLPNVAYLSGLHASSAALVIRADRVHLITDRRYETTAAAVIAELTAVDLVIAPASNPFDLAVAEVITNGHASRVGFEATHCSVKRHTELTRWVGGLAPASSLEPTESLVERLRIVKDAWELAVMREAAMRLSDAAKCIIPKVLAGMTERNVAAFIEGELRRVGFDKPAFDTIVASGPNSAVPHYRAGERGLTKGDLVVLDFGGMFHGYAVDMTRTLTMGPPSARQRRVLEDVAAAQDAAFAAVKPGVMAEEVDRAARESLARAGLAEAFGHGTGHGLGLEVHEGPRVAPARPGVSGEPLQPGMVFTIEPGAYFPNWGGVRIEDDATLTTSGAEWLTDVPRFWTW